MKAALALLALVLAGCTGLLQSVSDAAHRDSEQSSKLLASASEGKIRTHTIDDVVVDNGIWLSGRTVKLAQAASLPPVFSQPVTFDRQVASLQEFSERITRLTQVPAKVSADAVAASQRALAGMGGGAPGSLGKAGQTVNLPPLPTGRGAAAAAAAANDGFMPSSVRILYRSGDLKGLLDTACARFGISWKYADGTIDFYFTDTRTFQVSAVPGDSSVNANVVSEASNSGGTQSSGSGSAGSITGGGGNGGGTNNGVSSNNTSTTAVNSQLSIFGSLESAIKAMLSPYGHVVSAPATGSISVTDTPDVLERVARFMEEQNRVMSRQILVNVTVLSVTLSADDSYGINWGAVYQALGSRFSLTSAFTSGLTSAATLGAQVISPNSRADGTAALISALSQQGAVRRKTSASVTTLNNQPVPIQVATQQGYLASISTTNTANVGSQTSLTPGTVTTGFNMTLLPHMLDDGTVLMQFYTNLSVLDALQTVSSGGANPLQIQTPQIDTRNFLQRVAMKSGETLVISGYEGAADNSTQQGVGKPSNILLGGGYDARRSREVIVILITPLTVRTASGA